MGPLGLPGGITACLLDLDGVVTDTASVHTAAWAEAFDAFLRETGGDDAVPFDPVEDYRAHVDGRPRADGVRAFLGSRGIELPEGDPDDPPTAATVYGLGNRKNVRLLALLERDGVQVYDGTVRYLEAVRAAGLRTAVVSSSANTRQVLEVTGLAHLFEVRVDAFVAREQGLPGKPAPDTFVHAGRLLGAEPAACAVFEDALSGVEAGRAGRFGLVVGVDRVGQGAALAEHGADVVVTDLADLLR